MNAKSRTWQVDPVASTAEFTARNFMVGRVRGTFRIVRGTVVVDHRGLPSMVDAAVDVATVTTGNARRDGDLCGPRFLDVVHHPELTLVARDIRAVANGWQLRATVCVRGHRAPLALDVRPVAEPDPAGDGWRVEAHGTLDLGTTPIKAPRVLVGREVDVRISARLTGGR